MMCDDVAGFAFSDEETKAAMREVDKKHNYVLDPHGAVGYLALKEFQKKNPCTGIILETAHPTKFVEDVEQILGRQIPIPQRLADLTNKEKHAVLMSTEFQDFKNWMLETL